MKAHCLIREQPWYRRDAFKGGLAAAGHEVVLSPPDRPSPETLLVIWNRYSTNHELALRVERAGGRVLVAENGYIGKGGGTPKFQVHPAGPQPGHYYAIGLRFHNDETCINWGTTSRFDALAVELKPWRVGDHILVAPNRPFGIPERMMHPDWGERCVARLRKQTKRPIILRTHPGNNEPRRALSEDLKGAHAVYVWSSSCGVHALAEGIPTFVEAPYWIMKSASARGDIESPVLPERKPAFERLAWAQWTCEEIASGLPFRTLLPTA